MKNDKTKTRTILRVPPVKGIVAFNGVTLAIAIGLVLGWSLKTDNGLKLFFNMIPTLIITAFWLIFLIITTFYFVRNNYYVVDTDGINYYRFNKFKKYAYNDIIFIDQPWSEKHRKVNLLTKEGKEAFLPFDKQGVIYQLLNKNCRRLLTDDQMRTRFPGFKISIDKEYEKILKAEEKKEKKLEKEALKNYKNKQ